MFEFELISRSKGFHMSVLDDSYPFRLAHMLEDSGGHVFVSPLHEHHSSPHYHVFVQFPKPRLVRSVRSACLAAGAAFVDPADITGDQFVEIFILPYMEVSNDC